MAFRPSHRRRTPSYILDLNLAPFLSLFVALIPMLLLTAIFQQVSIVNLYLPSADDEQTAESGAPAGEDFTLTVTITQQQISLQKDDETLYEASRTVSGNLDGLSGELIRLKERFPEKRDIILLLDGSILYQTIITVMDTVRQDGGMELFPDISLADRLVKVD